MRRNNSRLKIGRWALFSRPLLIILVVAIALRLVAALYLGNSMAPDKDEISYSTLGMRLASGYGFSFPKGWYPGFVYADAPTSHWSFLYSAFVAGVYTVFGDEPVMVRLVSAVLGGIVLPWMMYRLARRVWPGRENLALMSAGLGAIYAYFILYAAQLMTETFFIATVLWSLERSLALIEILSDKQVDRRHALITAVGLGVSLGLATLFRQSILPWVAFSFVLMLWAGWKADHFRETFFSLFLSGCILIVFILPFTIRNYVVFGDFMLLNSNAGYALYAAQHPLHGTSFQAFAVAPLPEDLNPVPANEAEWDRVLMRRGFQFIVENPGRYALLSISRLADYFMFWPSAETSIINNIGRMFSFALLMPVMVYGLWLSTGEWRRYWLLYTFMVFYTVLHLLTWSMIRYRLPVDAVLLLFAAMGLVNLVTRWRGYRAEQQLSENAP